VRIVNFWATWCPPWRAEIPHFQPLYENISEAEITVIGISLDQTRVEIVRPFAESLGITLTGVDGRPQDRACIR